MAEIAAVTTEPGVRDDRVFVTTWTPLATGDTGDPVRHLSADRRCVQVYGTFNSATVTLQGSNDPDADTATWATLRDHAGSNIALTSAGIRQLAEMPLWIRPSVASGTATDLTVILVERRGLR